MQMRDSLLSPSRKPLTSRLENKQINKPQKKQGFTIVELLVVIVVIGILAAITIVSYSGISQRAKVSALQSDLDNASKKLKMYYTLYGSYPIALNTSNCPTAPSSDTNYCLKFSGNNTISYNGSTDAFSLAENNGSTNYCVTNNSAPTNGICPGVIVNESMATSPSTGLVYGNTADTQWNSGGYLVLTAAVNGEYGYIDYNQALPQNFDASFDFWMGPNNPGADAVWFYWGTSSSAPTTEDDYRGGYIASLDEYGGNNEPFRIGFAGVGDIAHTTGAALYSNSTWHHCDIYVRGTNIQMMYDGTTVLNVTDSVRSLGGSHFGLGSRTGGVNNEHRVKNFTVISR